MMANGSSSLKISLEVDNESALPRFLEGRNITIIGWPLYNDDNTESQKSNLYQQIIHERLKYAQQLHATLEEAADRAEALPNDNDSSRTSSHAQARAILESSMSEIDQLVRRTKTLDYEKGCSKDDAAMDTKIRSESEIEKQRRLRDGMIIRRQLRLFAKERNPDLEFDHELENRHDVLINLPEFNKESEINRVDDGTADGTVASIQLDEEESFVEFATAGEEKAVNNSAKPKETDENIKGDSDFASSFYKLSGRESRKRLAKGALLDDAQEKLESGETMGIVSGPKTHAKIRHALLVQSPSKKGGRIQQKEHIINDGSVFVNQEPAPVVDTAPTDGPPPLPPRKCHECKNMCTQYRSCHYWTWDVKCIKKYCIPCLLSNYTLGCDVISDTNPNGTHPADEIGINPEHDKEWHCPSCVAQRESEEERERIRINEASRKSSRKSTIGNNYAGFF